MKSFFLYSVLFLRFRLMNGANRFLNSLAISLALSLFWIFWFRFFVFFSGLSGCSVFTSRSIPNFSEISSIFDAVKSSISLILSSRMSLMKYPICLRSGVWLKPSLYLSLGFLLRCLVSFMWNFMPFSFWYKMSLNNDS